MVALFIALAVTMVERAITIWGAIQQRSYINVQNRYKNEVGNGIKIKNFCHNKVGRDITI